MFCAVICYGTEERNKNGFQIMPSNEVYDYIVFNGTEIKVSVINFENSRQKHFQRFLIIHPTFDVFLAKNSNFLVLCVPLILQNILVKPPSTRCLPKGAKIHQKVPLISNEKLEKPEKPEATNDLDASSVIDRYHIASNPFAQPQFPVSNLYDHRSNYVYQPLPCGLLNQAPIYNASELMFTPTNPSQSFFTTFPPVPISLPPVNLILSLSHIFILIT